MQDHAGSIKAEGAGGIDPYLTLVRDDPMQGFQPRFSKYYWEGNESSGSAGIACDRCATGGSG